LKKNSAFTTYNANGNKGIDRIELTEAAGVKGTSN
jgi:hypothetical protein